MKGFFVAALHTLGAWMMVVGLVGAAASEGRKGRWVLICAAGWALFVFAMGC